MLGCDCHQRPPKKTPCQRNAHPRPRCVQATRRSNGMMLALQKTFLTFSASEVLAAVMATTSKHLRCLRGTCGPLAASDALAKSSHERRRLQRDAGFSAACVTILDKQGKRAVKSGQRKTERFVAVAGSYVNATPSLPLVRRKTLSTTVPPESTTDHSVRWPGLAGSSTAKMAASQREVTTWKPANSGRAAAWDPGSTKTG